MCVPEQPPRDTLGFLCLSVCRSCAHLERRGQALQHPHGCAVTAALWAGSMRSMQLRRNLAIITLQTPLR